MDIAEVGRLLGLIAARYPNARLGEDENLTIQAWAITLEDVPAEPHMGLALREWFTTQKWPPDAAELRRLALDLGGPTPAMLARAEREAAAREHWQMLARDGSLSIEERQAQQRAFRASLELTPGEAASRSAPRLRAIG